MLYTKHRCGGFRKLDDGALLSSVPSDFTVPGRYQVHAEVEWSAQ